MKQETTSKAVTGVSIMAAIAASFCCISPLLAIVAGASGAASAFSWLEPARPFLIGVAMATLSFAWYRSLITKESAVCGPDESCETEQKSFLASRTFLVFITIAAIGLIAFPYYAKLFYPKPEKQNIVVVESNNIQTATFHIKGMTCAGCEEHVNNELHKVPGVMDAQTAYHKGTSMVKFDSSKATVTQLKTAIENTGYNVIEVK
ncbi:MAG: mercuric transport protein MerTP [Chitinophagaceae bacterium]